MKLTSRQIFDAGRWNKQRTGTTGPLGIRLRPRPLNSLSRPPVRAGSSMQQTWRDLSDPLFIQWLAEVVAKHGDPARHGPPDGKVTPQVVELWRELYAAAQKLPKKARRTHIGQVLFDLIEWPAKEPLKKAAAKIDKLAASARRVEKRKADKRAAKKTAKKAPKAPTAVAAARSGPAAPSPPPPKGFLEEWWPWLAGAGAALAGGGWYWWQQQQKRRTR